MAGNLSRIRGQLKLQWLAANKKVLNLRRKVAEAEQKAAALQRVLDAVEKAAPDLLKTPESAPVRRDSRNGVLSRIVEALKEKGPLNPNQIAEEVGASYRWVLLHLKQGPFRQEPRIGGKGGKTARRWVLDEEENGPNHAKGESES